MQKREVYFDTTVRRWKYKHNNTFAPDPTNKRCKFEGCEIIVRNRTGYCEKHTDWSTYAHASSLLSDDDVKYLAEHYQEMTDRQITDMLLLTDRHKQTKKLSLLGALQHHRRKYLEYRYSGKKFAYQKAKLIYAKQHPSCEICGWHEAACDIHHIWQENVFVDAYRAQWHSDANMLAVCPNHHRVVERLREISLSDYRKLLMKYKPQMETLYVVT